MILSSVANHKSSDSVEDEIYTGNHILIFDENDKKSSTSSQLLSGSNSTLAYEKINAFYHADNIETAIRVYDSVSVYNKTVIVGAIDGYNNRGAVQLSTSESNIINHTISSTNGSSSETGFVLVLDENFSIERSLRLNSTSDIGRSSVLHVINSSGDIAIAGTYSGNRVMINNNATNDWQGTGCGYMFIAKLNLTLETQYLTNVRNCRSTGVYPYGLSSDGNGNEYVITRNNNPGSNAGLYFNNNGVYSSSSIGLKQTMNGESCGGTGSNLVVAKVNNGTWNWAKQTGGQSKAYPHDDGLIYKNSVFTFLEELIRVPAIHQSKLLLVLQLFNSKITAIIKHF